MVLRKHDHCLVSQAENLRNSYMQELHVAFSFNVQEQKKKVAPNSKGAGQVKTEARINKQGQQVEA